MTISRSSFYCALLPIFAGEDYNHWQKKMETFFISQGLWNLVQNGKTLTAPTAQRRIYKEDKKDAQALYYIQQAVAPTIFPKIVSFSSAKTAWDFLKAKYNTMLLEDMDFHAIEILENLDPPTWVPMNYDKIRKRLRLCDLKVAVYIPRLISIGPLHYGRPELANMQISKICYARCFLNRIQKPKDLFVGFITKHEKTIRLCYSEPSDLSKREYVEMIMLDSFFILEFIFRSRERLNLDEVQHRSNIVVDLMLIENQLPLSLLFEIFKIAFDDSTVFFDQCKETFKVFYNDPLRLYREEVMTHLNFTSLVRQFKCRGVSAEMKILQLIQPLKYPARKLSESNVKFVGTVRGSLTNITFENRVLKLPKFTVDNTTERVYGNLIGFEHCDYQFKEENYICGYILFLGYLMKNSDDVAVLVEDRVIVNELGSNQAVVDMLNRLCRNFKIDYFYYTDICTELNDYCSSWKGWRNYCRKLLNDVYFTNIWIGTGTIAAVILLFLTLTQAVTSIMQVM